MRSISAIAYKTVRKLKYLLSDEAMLFLLSSHDEGFNFRVLNPSFKPELELHARLGCTSHVKVSKLGFNF